jgi:hypothetical protein
MNRYIFLFWICSLGLLLSCSEDESEEEVVEEVKEVKPELPSIMDTTYIGLEGQEIVIQLQRMDVDSFLLPFKIYLPQGAELSIDEYVPPKRKNREVHIGDRYTITFDGGRLEFGDLNSALDNEEARQLVKKLYNENQTLRKFKPDYRFSIYKIIPENPGRSIPVVHVCRKKGKLFYVREFFDVENKRAQESLYYVIINSILWN